MRVAILQFAVATGDVDTNLKQVERLVASAMAAPEAPDVLVLPELWSTGYALRRMAELASSEGERELEFLGTLARRYNVAFAGGSVMALSADGTYGNRAQVIDKEGRLVGFYDKIHLFGLMEEDVFFHHGRKRLSFTLDGVKCGVAVCYDIRFGELITRLALDGAEVLFVSAAWPKARVDHWRLLACAHAVESQLYVVACNRCGVTKQATFGGNSLIVDPEGRILAEAGEEESILTADLDISKVSLFRSKLPALADRRPETYCN